MSKDSEPPKELIELTEKILKSKSLEELLKIMEVEKEKERTKQQE